ncbi:MAG: mechanosensitive ion channel [Cetobacterium sp.]|nr:mechanosensitive ion channel [Cetobacterium sp.]
MKNLNLPFNILRDERGENILHKLFYESIDFLIRLLIFLIFLYIGSLCVKKILKYFDKLPALNSDLSTQQFIRSIIKIGLYGIFVVIGLLLFGFSESSIATMISAIGLGIGISLKEFLSNFAGGIIIFFTRPFVVGNFIKINGVMGEVYKISVFSTEINSLDSRRIIIPNTVMISNNLINFDSNDYRRIQLTVSVAYGSNLKQVIDILNKIANTYPDLDKTKENFINTMTYGDSSLNILFLVWTKREGYYKVRGELMAYILDKLTEEKVDIPFNTLTVNIEKD